MSEDEDTSEYNLNQPLRPRIPVARTGSRAAVTIAEITDSLEATALPASAGLSRRQPRHVEEGMATHARGEALEGGQELPISYDPTGGQSDRQQSGRTAPKMGLTCGLCGVNERNFYTERNGFYRHMHKSHEEIQIPQRLQYSVAVEHCLLGAGCVRPNLHPGECRNRYRKK